MKKDILRKGWIVIVIFLLIGISIAPIVNANFNRILPTTKNNGEVEERDFIEVTCQVSTLRGIRQVVKNIPQIELDKITKLANEVNALLDGKCSVTKLREKVSALAVELKEVGLLPKGTAIEDTVNIMVHNIIRKVNPHSFISDNRSQNLFCFIFGAGDNKTAFLVLRQHPLFALRGLLWECLGLDDPYIMGPVLRLLVYKPKFLALYGQWVSYSSNATLISVGLNGMYKIKDEGYGAYCLEPLGFIGISVGSGAGGFICGFCLYSNIYFNPIETTYMPFSSGYR